MLAPSVVLPIVGGISAWFLSWAAGGSVPLDIAGLIGVLGGTGWLATRFIFLTDKITEKVLNEIRQKLKDEEDRRLAELQKKLRRDRDPRTQDYLLLLRNAKDDFEEVANRPGVEKRSAEIIQQVRQLFESAIQQLDRTYKHWELAERLTGAERAGVMHQREQILQEVKEAVDHLEEVAKQYRDLMVRERNVDLSRLRDDLDTSLRIAKRTEERMRELESGPNYEFLRE